MRQETKDLARLLVRLVRFELPWLIGYWLIGCWSIVLIYRAVNRQ